ncbi:hypothetical protein [Mucilaginibacter corticis]|nr:hypothetical protein [Mucilaginibacter corticis]
MIEINNDRVAGFEKAIADIKAQDISAAHDRIKALRDAAKA